MTNLQIQTDNGIETLMGTAKLVVTDLVTGNEKEWFYEGDTRCTGILSINEDERYSVAILSGIELAEGSKSEIHEYLTGNSKLQFTLSTLTHNEDATKALSDFYIESTEVDILKQEGERYSFAFKVDKTVDAVDDVTRVYLVERV